MYAFYPNNYNILILIINLFILNQYETSVTCLDAHQADILRGIVGELFILFLLKHSHSAMVCCYF